MELELIDHFYGTNMRIIMATIYKRQPHFHNDIELIMPIQGSLCMHVGPDNYLIKKDEMFLISQNEIHSGTQTDEDNILIVLEVSPNFCKSFYPRLERMHIKNHHITQESHPELYKALRASMQNIILYCGRPKEEYKLLIHSSLCLFVYNILKYADVAELTQSEADSNMRNWSRLSHIIEYLRKNYMHPVSLADLAKKEGLNPSYLSRFISDNLGMSFRNYVNSLRLDHAVHLLTSTNMRKADICIECGFSDPRYLNKEIMKNYGCTPEQFRSKNVSGVTRFFEKDGNIHSEQHRIIDIKFAYERLKQYFISGS